MTQNLRAKTFIAAWLLLALSASASAQITSLEGDGVLNAPYRGTITSLREATMDVPYGEVLNHVEPVVPDQQYLIISHDEVWVWAEGDWDRSVLRLYEGADASGPEIDLTGTSEEAKELLARGNDTFKRFSLKAIGTKTLAPQTFTVRFEYKLNGITTTTDPRPFTVVPTTGSFTVLPGESEAFHYGTPILDVVTGNCRLTVPVGQTVDMIGAAYNWQDTLIGNGGCDMRTQDCVLPGAAESLYLHEKEEFFPDNTLSGGYAMPEFATPWAGHLVGARASGDIYMPDGTHYDSDVQSEDHGLHLVNRLLLYGIGQNEQPAQVYVYGEDEDNRVYEIHDETTPQSSIAISRTPGNVTITTSDGRAWNIYSNVDGWITGVVPQNGKGARYYKYNEAGRVIQVRLGAADGGNPDDPDVGQDILYKFVYDLDGDLSEEWRYIDGAMRKVVKHEKNGDDSQRVRKDYFGAGPNDYRKTLLQYDTVSGLDNRLVSVTTYDEPAGAGTAYTTTYGHNVDNPRGNMTIHEATLPDGSTLTHDYDSNINGASLDLGFRTKTTHTKGENSLVLFDVDYEFLYTYTPLGGTNPQQWQFYSPRIVNVRDGRHNAGVFDTEIMFNYEDGGDDENGDNRTGEICNQLLERTGPTITQGISGVRTPFLAKTYHTILHVPIHTETNYDATNTRDVSVTYDNKIRISSKTVDPGDENLQTRYFYCDTSDTQNRIVVDPDGYWTVEQFDNDGRIISERVYLTANTTAPADPCAMPPTAGNYYETQYVYDNAGRLDYILVDNKDQQGNALDPATIKTDYSYDRLGRLTLRVVDAVTGGINQETHYEYNWLNEVTLEYDTSGRGVKRDYDACGRLVKETPRDENENLITDLATEYEYDEMGRLWKTKPPTGRFIENLYDDFGRLQYVIRHPGPDGGDTYTTTYEYDKASNITRTTVKRGSGAIVSDTTAKYDEAGFKYETRQRTVGTAAGTDSTDDPLVQFGYDWMGNVVQERAAAGPFVAQRSITTTYDKANRVEKIEDSEGGETEFDRDDRGNVTEKRVKLTDTETAYTNTEFDALSRPTHITQPRDGKGSGDRHYTKQWYDSRGNLLRQTHFDADDTAKMTTVFGYDDAGRRKRTAVLANAVAPLTTLAADAVVTTDRVVDTAYDEDGRVQDTTTYNSDSDTPCTTHTDYDALGRVNVVRDPASCTITNHYDLNNGRLWKRVINDRPGEAPRQYTFLYDGHDRVTYQTAFGTPTLVTKFEYDALDRRIGVADLYSDIQTRTHYDLVGRVEEVIQDEEGPNEWHTEFAYDRHSNLATRTTCNASSAGGLLLAQNTQYRYDSLGRLLRTLYPDSTGDPADKFAGDCVRSEYDDAGRVIWQINQRNLSTDYTYDDRGLMLTRETGNARDTFSYDALGRLKGTLRGSPTKPAQTSASALAYTDLGDVEYEDQTIGNGSAHRIDYAYDQAGNRKQVDYESGRTLVYAPTPTNRVDSIWMDGHLLTDYDYEGHMLTSRRTATTAGGDGVVYECGFDYDSHRRINAVNNGVEIGEESLKTIANYTFTRDSRGNPLTQTVDGPSPFGDDDRAFTPDTLNRLMAMQNTTAFTTESVVFDLVGNRETYTVTDHPARSYALANEANEYLSITVAGGSRAVLEYDESGNLTKDEVERTYTYDEQNRLVAVNAADSTLLARYMYDALGRRIYFDNPASGVTRYYYDGQSVIEEYDTNDTLVRTHVHGGQYIDEHIVTIPGTTGSGKTINDDESYYYLLNDLYTVVGLGDEDGNIVEDYEYSAYGLSDIGDGLGCLRGDLNDDGVVDIADQPYFVWLLESPADGTARMLCAADMNEDGLVDGNDIDPFAACLRGTCPTPPSGVSPVHTPYTLHGRPVDVLSDGLMLQYNRARHYDITNGRWLQRDPKGYVDGGNLYEAFGGNPRSKVDPEGAGVLAWLAAGRYDADDWEFITDGGPLWAVGGFFQGAGRTIETGATELGRTVGYPIGLASEPSQIQSYLMCYVDSEHAYGGVASESATLVSLRAARLGVVDFFGATDAATAATGDVFVFDQDGNVFVVDATGGERFAAGVAGIGKFSGTVSGLGGGGAGTALPRRMSIAIARTGTRAFSELAPASNATRAIVFRSGLAIETAEYGLRLPATASNSAAVAFFSNEGAVFGTESLGLRGFIVSPASGKAAASVQINKCAGDLARDFTALRYAPVSKEVNFEVTGGLRRVDVFKSGGTRTAIEVKVGRTSLTRHVRRQLARDMKILRSQQIDSIIWEFYPSARTGLGGPTAPLAAKLRKLGIKQINMERPF